MDAVKVVALDFLWPRELESMVVPRVRFVCASNAQRRHRDRALADAQIVISTAFDRSMARACKQLRLLLCPAAGTERIERGQLPVGTKLLHGVGHEVPIAEYVWGTLIALRQRLFCADRELRRGRWQFGYLQPRGFVGEVYGSTMGLIGFGAIGAEIAQRAAAFGVRCRAVTLNPSRRRPHRHDVPLGRLDVAGDVDRLVQEADALVLCCELSPLTHAIVDARRLRMMKRDAVLINVARGALVEERALYDALHRRTIAAAAIDVWYRYPKTKKQRVMPSYSPFHRLDNVIMTPHCSGWTDAQKQRKLRFLAEAIEGFVKAL